MKYTSYCVDSLATLFSIFNSGIIKESDALERNPDKHTKMKYISLSRNITSHAIHNPDRWAWGVVLDMEKLSCRYKIQPFSWSYNYYNKCNLKSIQRYDNGKCFMTLVNHARFEIPFSIYKKTLESINKFCSTNPEEASKRHYKCVHGVRARNGVLKLDEHQFSTPTGCNVRLLNLDPEVKSWIINHSPKNDTEERIWIPKKYTEIADRMNADKSFVNTSRSHFKSINIGNKVNMGIDISNCIAGIVLPEMFHECMTSKDYSTKVFRWNNNNIVKNLPDKSSLELLHDLIVKNGWKIFTF